MSRYRKAAHATIVVQIFNVAGMLLSLAAVPLYLRWLGQERYGVLLTGLAFAGYLMFTDAGLSWSSMLLISQANGRNDQKGMAAIVRNSFSLAACSALLVALLVTGLVCLISLTQFCWLPRQPEVMGLLVAVGCSVMSTLFLSPFYNLFSGMQAAHLTALYQGLGRIIGTLASLGVASTGAPLGAVFGSNVTCCFLIGLVAAFHCGRKHPWIFEKGSFWDVTQVRLQLRTGAKSFGMQIGSVLGGTAPVLAISSAAGPQYVPYYSIPFTLLNLPLSLISSFNANLQAGYGEAIGRNETAWVADAVRQILKQVIFFVGLLSVGFFLLAIPFIQLWTGGHMVVSLRMLASVWLIAVTGSFLSVFRFALTGINRHRIAAASDLVFGVLAMAFANLAVRGFGYEWVGISILFTALLTSAWVLPRELRRALLVSDLWPLSGFWFRWSGVCLLVLAISLFILQISASLPTVLAMCATALVVVSLYVILVERFLPDEWKLVSFVKDRLNLRWSL